MKLNINKFQTGGRVYFSAVANPYKSASTKTSSDDDGLIPDKLLEKLSENGNPNDVNKFIGMLAKFEHEQNFGLGVGKSQLYGLRAYANQIIKQSEYLDRAEERATNNGALDEAAVDSRGYLFTKTETGELKKVHASEFKAGEQQALTVAELMQERRFNPEETDNENLTTTIGNNIGTEKINSYIWDIIKSIGSTDSTSEAYQDIASIIGRENAKRPTEEQMLAIQDLYNLSQKVGPDAIFKVKDEYKSKNINDAMKYILSMLPNNMRTQLVARNVVMGGKFENSDKYAYDIVANALNAGNDTKIVHGIDYEGDLNKAAGTAKDQTKNLGVMQQLVQGTLGKRDYKLVSSKNPSVSMTLHGSGVGSLADFNNNVVDKTTLSVAMKASLAPLIDQNHVTMGDQKIESGMFDTILYDGGDVINIWAPTDNNGDIDLDQLQVFQEIQSVIKQNPQLTNEDKNQLLQEHNLSGYFDEQGTFHGQGNMAQFLVMTGLTSDEVIDPELNLYADKLTKQQKDLEMPQIERIYGQLNKGIKSRDGQYKFQKGLFNFTTDLVKAPIFMKLNQTAQIDVGTFSDKGPTVRTPSYQEQIAYDQSKYQRENNKTNFVAPSAGMLYE